MKKKVRFSDTVEVFHRDNTRSIIYIQDVSRDTHVVRYCKIVNKYVQYLFSFLQ